MGSNITYVASIDLLYSHGNKTKFIDLWLRFKSRLNNIGLFSLSGIHETYGTDYFTGIELKAEITDSVENQIVVKPFSLDQFVEVISPDNVNWDILSKNMTEREQQFYEKLHEQILQQIPTLFKYENGQIVPVIKQKRIDLLFSEFENKLKKNGSFKYRPSAKRYQEGIPDEIVSQFLHKSNAGYNVGALKPFYIPVLQLYRASAPGNLTPGEHILHYYQKSGSVMDQRDSS